MSKVVDVQWTNSLVEMASAFQFNISAMDTRIVTIKVMRILGCVKVKYNPQFLSQDECLYEIHQNRINRLRFICLN